MSVLPRLAAAGALAAAFVAGAARAEQAYLKAIAPGNEPLVAEMLGGPLPLGCALDEAAIERTRVVARYVCAAGTATITLHHRDDPAAAAPVARTGAFAIVGAAPRELVDAIAAHVAAREGAWRWISVEPPRHAPGPTPAAEALAGPPPPHRFFATPKSFAATAIAIAAAGSLALHLALRRARA